MASSAPLPLTSPLPDRLSHTENSCLCFKTPTPNSTFSLPGIFSEWVAVLSLQPCSVVLLSWSRMQKLRPTEGTCVSKVTEPGRGRGEGFGCRRLLLKTALHPGWGRGRRSVAVCSLGTRSACRHLRAALQDPRARSGPSEISVLGPARVGLTAEADDRPPPPTLGSQGRRGPGPGPQHSAPFSQSHWEHARRGVLGWGTPSSPEGTASNVRGGQDSRRVRAPQNRETRDTHRDRWGPRQTGTEAWHSVPPVLG